MPQFVPEKGQFVENMDGLYLGEVSNLIVVSGSPTATIKMSDGAYRNHPVANLRPYISDLKPAESVRPVERPPTFEFKAIDPSEPAVPVPASMVRAEQPGVFDFGSIQIFVLGEHRYLVAEKSSLWVGSNSAGVVLNYDPEARIIVVARDNETATFTPLDQSVEFRELVQEMVDVALAKRFPASKPRIVKTTRKTR